MTKRTQGLNRTAENKTSECAGEGGPASADAVATFATLHFHPKCAERLEDSIQKKRQALVTAARDAIPSVENAINRLQSSPDGIDPASAERLTSMLHYALQAMQSSLTEGGSPDREALNRRKREMMDLQTRLLAALEEVRQAQT